MARGDEVTLEVHVYYRVPIVFAQIDEDAVPQDSGVVDEDVQVTKSFNGITDETRSPIPVRNVVVIRHGLATHGPNFCHHFLGRRRGARRSVQCASQVVDDDACALRREE